VEEVNRVEVIKEKIEKLITNSEKAGEYLTLIKKMAQYEREHKDDEYNFGWQMENIEGLNGGHIAKLLQHGIIAKSPYYSNNYHCYMLTEKWDVVEKAVEEIENLLEEQMAEQSEMPEPVTLPFVDVNDYKAKFEQLIKEYDMLDYWARYINPKVTGLERVKKALLLSIASVNDRYGDRGRIHVLLLGDPGTAKSMLLLWLAHYLGAKYCTHRSSDAGLTGAWAGKDIVPGALPLADGHVICIDELDKFQAKDFAGLLEALSNGRVTINVGGLERTFNARVRCIAGCNRIEKFPEELLDRFDFKIKLEAPKRDDEKRIIADIIDSWFTEKPSYDGRELRAYLQWIADFEPKISPETRKIIKKVIQMYIDLRKDDKGNIRRDEAIIRVAYTIAKLNRRDVIPEDVVRAIELLDETMTEGKLKGIRLLIEKEKEKLGMK